MPSLEEIQAVDLGRINEAAEQTNLQTDGFPPDNEAAEQINLGRVDEAAEPNRDEAAAEAAEAERAEMRRRLDAFNAQNRDNRTAAERRRHESLREAGWTNYLWPGAPTMVAANMTFYWPHRRPPGMPAMMPRRDGDN